MPANVEALNAIKSTYTTVIEYDASDNAIYVGEAKPSTKQDASGWRIKKITYDGNNPTDVKWAEGSNAFGFIWDSRTTYSYS